MNAPLSPGDYELFDGASPETLTAVGSAATGLVGREIRQSAGSAVLITPQMLADTLIFGAADLLARAGMNPRQVERRMRFVLVSGRQFLDQARKEGLRHG